ncbi:MAG: FAD-binding oxidoreductase [Gemmatimonadota bacterium]
MTPIAARTLDNGSTTVSSGEVEQLRDRLRGPLLTEGDGGYEEARTLWNAMIDERPALIAQCTCAADVRTAVHFAREHGLLLSVRGGGHNVAGDAVCGGGLMIDLSPMSAVEVNPETRTARVGAGATVADLDEATQRHGLATTGGIVSTTGVAGLTLGGGLGYLSRKHGLAHDSLRSADVATAHGDLVRAAEDENSDLFWGLRGGGGNFGVVTSFEFDLHEVGPEILSVQVIHPYEAVPDALRCYREFMADAPKEVQVYAALLQGSAELDLPEALHGETLLSIGGLYAGEIADGRDAFRPLREFGDPIADLTQPMPYLEHQRQVDDLFREGHRNYWKSSFYGELSDGLIEAVVERADPVPSPWSSVFFEWMGGAVAEAAPDATAFAHRDATLSLTVAPKWEDPGRDEAMIGWAREFHEATAPYAADGVYVNYLDKDEGGRVSSAYGGTYGRLVELKNEWDPQNLFRRNQNIEPTV